MLLTFDNFSQRVEENYKIPGDFQEILTKKKFQEDQQNSRRFPGVFQGVATLHFSITHPRHEGPDIHPQLMPNLVLIGVLAPPSLASPPLPPRAFFSRRRLSSVLAVLARTSLSRLWNLFEGKI